VNIKEDIARGAKAQALLSDPLLNECLGGMRAAILAKIESAPIAADAEVHELRIMLKLLRDLKGNMDLFIRDGKLAEAQLIEDTKRANKRR
jgi:hypothetical protein